jgi:hypothetical protein
MRRLFEEIHHVKTNILRSVNSLFLALVLVATAATAFAADLSGTWNVDGSVYGNAVKYACTLKQDGEKLTGTATLTGKDYPVTGTVSDTAVTWKFQIDYNGSPLELVFAGTADADGHIKGKIAVAGVEGEFTAQKQ